MSAWQNFLMSGGQFNTQPGSRMAETEMNPQEWSASNPLRPMDIRMGDFLSPDGTLRNPEGYKVDPSTTQYSQGAPPSNTNPEQGFWMRVQSATPTYSYSSEGGQQRTDPGDQYVFLSHDAQKQPEAPQAAPMPRREEPAPVTGTIYDSWDDYQRIARNDTEGLNRMPFIGPQGQWGRENYGTIPTDPLLALEMFYPGSINRWGSKLRDPLEGELLKPIAT